MPTTSPIMIDTRCSTQAPDTNPRLTLPAQAGEGRALVGRRFCFHHAKVKFRISGATDCFLPAGSSRAGLLGAPFLYLC